MKIFQMIKSKSKAILGLVLGAAMLAQTFGFAQTAQAAGTPHFNVMQNDQELLRGANRTANQSGWTDPISGVAGDTFAGMIYYHNGVTLDDLAGAAATNVHLKLNIPAQTSGNTAVLSAAITADNSPAVTDTIYNGAVVGRSGLTVNLDQPATLALVPGSVKWFANNNSQTPMPSLLNGQTGAELVNGSGLFVGNILTCWDFTGWVQFQFKTTAVAQASVSVNKLVRNVTIGETAFVKSDFAKPGDTLEYSVIVKNTGAGTADNLFLTDTIPADTAYLSNTTAMGRNGAQGVAVADGITGDGISLGSLATNESVEVRFRVKVGQGVHNGATLTNTAFLNFNKQVLPSTAQTIVKFGVTTPPVGGTLPVTGGDNTILTILTIISGALAGLYVKSRKLLAVKSW